jgi:signal transduction histidine kinase
VTCLGFFGYELYVFRISTKEKLSIIGGMIAANSTAALAFNNEEDAREILSALTNEPHVTAAALYDKNGRIFATYQASSGAGTVYPKQPGVKDYRFVKGYFEGSQPVKLQDDLLGYIYLKYDINRLYYRLSVFAVVLVIVTALSWLLALLLSKNLQRNISAPVLVLAKTAKDISEKRDYSVRAEKFGNDELGILTDAFNHMLSEAELFHRHLEEKVKERTAQLETLNRELESFSYSVSHDLRAPLRAVSGYATMLKEDYGEQVEAEGRRYMNTIIQNAAKMGTLIDDLLAFSRTGRKEIVLQQVNMTTLVESCINEIKESEDISKYSITVGRLPDCEADHPLIRQVWMNLIGNAVKYSGKEEHPVIHIDSTKSAGEHIYFVKDNGVGFDMKYAHKLFGVFQRLHTEQEFEGTGIGLALVNRIITRHKGRTWAEAEPGKGATIYFSIPNNTKS